MASLAHAGMAGEPELRRGDQGEWVTYLQGYLRSSTG
jgi:hypothetical protein